MFLPCSGEQMFKSLVCQVFVASIYLCVCVSFGVRNALGSGTSVSACVSAAVALCVHWCLCCLPAGCATQRCVDYFLPYIAVTGHVVSPAVAFTSVALSLFYLSLKPEYKCCTSGSHGLFRMCSGP